MNKYSILYESNENPSKTDTCEITASNFAEMKQIFEQKFGSWKLVINWIGAHKNIES